MGRRILLVGCLTTILVCSSVAEAQRRIPAYRSRSTISPYVNLFQSSNAGLNSYFGALRPRQLVEQQFRETNNEFLFQQQQLEQRSLLFQQELEDTLTQSSTLMTRPTTGTGAAVRRPAGTFMNYSTYFPGSGGTMSRPRAGR
jgi:hypothetical protein